MIVPARRALGLNRRREGAPALTTKRAGPQSVRTMLTGAFNATGVNPH
jgi:hypothetical protein